MAHFYGTIQGNRGQASRLGSKNSGFHTIAASWEGAVVTRLWHDEESGVDWCEVRLSTWGGMGTERLLYRGPVGRYAPFGLDATEVIP
jgi:hypothetical protein